MTADRALIWFLESGAFWRLRQNISETGDTWEIGVFWGKALQTFEGTTWQETVLKAYKELKK